MSDEHDETPAAELTQSLRTWVELDDEARRIGERLKQIREQKITLGNTVLSYMRENQLDDFKLEGMASGTISRSVRTYKPGIKRNTIRTQLLLHFGDQPSKVTDALRAIEGIAEGEDTQSVGTTKELLTRRIPKAAPRTQTAIQLNN